MSKREASTAVMDPELIQAALRQCDETEDADANVGQPTTIPARDGLPSLLDTQENDTRDRLPRVGAGRQRVFELACAVEAIPWHRLDHRVGYLLRHIDGQRSDDELTLGSGIADDEAEAIFHQLLAEGWIRERS